MKEKKLYIPKNQLESKQKAVDIMEGDKIIGINVTKRYALKFVTFWNAEIKKE